MDDRTRAIVKAADELATALCLTLLRDADGRPFAIQHYDFADAKVCSPAGAALRMLADALALPAPQWTRTPPSEPGCYHMRRHSGASVVYCIVYVYPDLRMVDFAWGRSSVPFAELENAEWFPVRINGMPA